MSVTTATSSVCLRRVLELGQLDTVLAAVRSVGTSIGVC
jgi:hypothetical protein